jgi:hypothetical protein
MRVLRAPLPLLVYLLLLTEGTSHAGHVTDLATAFDKGNPYDFNLQVGYTRSLKRGSIKREVTGIKDNKGNPLYADGVQTFKEARFTQTRHILSIRGELAIFRDLQLSLEFPIILQDTRSLDFAQNGGDDCGNPVEINCVTKRNSTLVKQGFLPQSMVNNMNDRQVELAGPNATPNMFDLPNRAGLDQFHLGLSWAPLNQKRDPTKPTWVIGFEARIAVGDPMEHNGFQSEVQAKFKGAPGSILNPSGNTSVGRGIHELMWFTTVSRRWRYIDPWIHFFYMFPVATKDSMYEKTEFDLSGQERHTPQQTGGVEAGMEIVAWEQPAKNNKFTIELYARLEGRFEGRGYSELWEIFANNPVLAGPCRPRPDSKFYSPSKWNNGSYCLGDLSSNDPSNFIPYPGLSKIENYATFKASLAFNLDFTKYFRARLGVSLGHEQQHFITFGDAGRDLGGIKGIDSDLETEVNPMYRPFVDMVGRRFRVGETTVFDFFASLEGRF